MKSMRTILLAGFACMFLTVAAAAQPQIKHDDLVGEYQSNTGTVTITYGTVKGGKNVDFMIAIQTDNGCEGEVRGAAKPVKGRKNFYVWKEKMSADKNYGPNARYRIELLFARKRVTVKERSLGANRDITYYRGMRCTFNGVFKLE
jgi:hypothetical protein